MAVQTAMVGAREIVISLVVFDPPSTLGQTHLAGNVYVEKLATVRPRQAFAQSPLEHSNFAKHVSKCSLKVPGHGVSLTTGS